MRLTHRLTCYGLVIVYAWGAAASLLNGLTVAEVVAMLVFLLVFALWIYGIEWVTWLENGR